MQDLQKVQRTIHIKCKSFKNLLQILQTIYITYWFPSQTHLYTIKSLFRIHRPYHAAGIRRLSRIHLVVHNGYNPYSNVHKCLHHHHSFLTADLILYTRHSIYVCMSIASLIITLYSYTENIRSTKHACIDRLQKLICNSMSMY